MTTRFMARWMPRFVAVTDDKGRVGAPQHAVLCLGRRETLPGSCKSGLVDYNGVHLLGIGTFDDPIIGVPRVGLSIYLPYCGRGRLQPGGSF